MLTILQQISDLFEHDIIEDLNIKSVKIKKNTHDTLINIFIINYTKWFL